MKHRVLVCGGRHFTDVGRIKQALIDLGGKDAIEIVIHGDNGSTDKHGKVIRGADKFAGVVAEELDIPVRPVPAEWGLLGSQAGSIRNQRMLDEFNPTICLAFPDPESRGTWDMVRRAKKAGLEVKIFK